MAESVGALRVDLSANSAQFGADMRAARGHLGDLGSSFRRIGGIAGETGDLMARGLKRGVNDFRELGAAAGLVGGEFGKLGASIADMALTGFSPLSLALAGVGFLIGSIRDSGKETFTKTLPEALSVTARAARDAFDDVKRLRAELRHLGDGDPEKIAKLKDAIRAQEREHSRLGVGDDRQAGQAKLDFLREQLALEEKILASRVAQAHLDKIFADIEKERAETERLRLANAAGAAERGVREGASTGSALGDALSSVKTGTSATLRPEVVAARKQLDEALDEIDKSFQPPEPSLFLQHMGIATLDQDAVEAAARFRAMDRAWDAQLARADFGKGFEAQMRKNAAASKEFGVVGGQVADRLTKGFSNDLAGALMQVADGSKSAKEAFSAFSKAVVTDLTRMILEAVIFRGVMAAIGFAAPAAAAPGAGNAATGASAGASNAGIADGWFGKSAKVSVYNYNGSQVGVQDDVDADGGRHIKVLIRNTMLEDVARDGPHTRALRARHGLSTATRRRS